MVTDSATNQKIESSVKVCSIEAEVEVQTYKGEKLEKITSGVKGITIEHGLESPWERWKMSLLPIQDNNRTSWYHRLSPMDYFEIRFAHVENKPEGPPVVMRGFLDSVSQKFSVDAQGKPQRSYDIEGTGLISKLLLDTKVYYLSSKHAEILHMIWGPVDDYNIPLQGSFHDVLSTIWKYAYSADGLGKSQWEKLRRGYSTIPVPWFLIPEGLEGNFNPATLQQDGKTIGAILVSSMNHPWNECFPVETSKGPALILRATPWKNRHCEYIQSAVKLQEHAYETLKEIPINSSDVLSVELNRKSTEVRNVYFTTPENAKGIDQNFRANAAGKILAPKLENPYISDPEDEYCGAYRYGFQYYDTSTQYVNLYAGQKEDERAQVMNVAASFCSRLNSYLAEAMYLNSVYEDGTFVLKGNENIKPGVYLQWGDGEYYVTHVTHSLKLIGQGSFSTTCKVVRGTGYLEARRKRRERKRKEREALNYLRRSSK